MQVLNVVFGHPAVLLECKPWCELLRRCLGRGAYRGYGSQHVRNALSGKRSAYESVPEDEAGDTEVGEADDVWGELAQLAKTALLGGGYAQQVRTPCCALARRQWCSHARFRRWSSFELMRLSYCRRCTRDRRSTRGTARSRSGA